MTINDNIKIIDNNLLYSKDKILPLKNKRLHEVLAKVKKFEDTLDQQRFNEYLIVFLIFLIEGDNKCT